MSDVSEQRGASGPIEELLRDLLTRELSPLEARQAAAAPEVVGALSQEYVSDLCGAARRAARGGMHAEAVQLLELLIAATEAGGADAAPWQRTCKLSFIEVVHAYLMQIPDGRLYTRAMAYGDELVASPETRAQALHSLGTMNLDPYSTDRTSEAYWEAYRLWLQRTPLGPAGFPVPGSEMPEPAEALHRADQFLERAVEARTGAARGASRKARVEALMMLRAVGEAIDPSTVERECRLALTELTWEDSPGDRIVLMNTLRVLGQPVEPEEVEQVFVRSLDYWRRRLGPHGAGNLVLQIYLALREAQPRRVLDLLVAAQSLVPELTEQARIGLWRAELTVLATYLPDVPDALPDEPVTAAARRLSTQASQEDWDPERLFGALLGVIVAAPARDEEDAALGLLDAAASVAPLAADRHAPALERLRGTHLLGVGVNGHRRSDWPESVRGYTQALEVFLGLELPQTATDCLRRIADIVHQGQGGTDVALAFAQGLASVALTAERTIGTRAAAILRASVEDIVGRASTQLDADTLLFLFQLVKGLRFATALYSGSRYQWADDPPGVELLDAIAEAEAQEAGDELTWAPLDEHTLLADYEPPEDEAEEADGGRLARLRGSYDEHLWEGLLQGALGQEALWLASADIQAALDERTALLAYLLGPRANGHSPVNVVVVMTRRNVRSYVIPQEEQGFQSMVIDGHVMPSWLGLATLVAREGVQASPGPGLVSEEGGQALEADYWRYFAEGQVLEGLREEGVDHLCIVPHGSLHYHPMHLIGPPERPLADDWIVTYLPNLHLFVSRRGLPSARRHRDRAMTAIGLGFGPGNPHGLPPIDRAVPEARAVAEIFGAAPLAEEQATEAAVCDALERSRFVHLSTHGRHDAEAPAFQCLYLSPDADADGRLYAHELLSLDLRGLDLVTLSACESALGRFDASDNLRGLPAGLLLSGASTLVGTLWEVEPWAAERFFTALYRELRDGVGCIDAFRTAQAVTRAEHPAYRDWGAFYLAGDWLW